MSFLTDIEVEEIVRVKQPKVVMFTFIGTLTPTDWERHCFDHYVNEHFKDYLDHNWNDIRVYRLIQLLKDQSFDQHVVFENGNVPLVLPFDLFNANWKQVNETVKQYVFWQFNQAKATPEVRCLINLCLTDGYKQGKIKTILYDDVKATLEHYRSLNICIAIFSEIEAELTRLCLSSCDSGDLSPLINHYLDENIVGQRMEPKTFDNMATLLGCNKEEILFICDHGHNVRLAHASSLQVVIILRPDNLTRTFYRLRFPATKTLKAIEFVNTTVSSSNNNNNNN